MSGKGWGLGRSVFVLVCGALLAAAMPAWAADGDYVWAKQIGGSGSDQGRSVTVDSSGNVYTTGYFGGTVDFDPGRGNIRVRSRYCHFERS